MPSGPAFFFAVPTCFQLVGASMLATESSRVQKDLAVSWKGETIAQPKLIEVMVTNTGREPVEGSDYETPITIEVTDGKVLEANVRASFPDKAVSRGLYP